MSIATKTGDAGTTGLMYNLRVPKNDPRVEAYGAVDELNAAIGLARSSLPSGWIPECLLNIQKDLIVLMGELATGPGDLERYMKDGFSLVTPAMVETLDNLVCKIEARKIRFEGWVIPGATPGSAALDMARTICRKAERRVCVLSESGGSLNKYILIYLNRLSDALWLMARWIENQNGDASGGAE